MVYCGKASQGCQLCRTRRIKCDKVKPECSQCIRVGKKCPGYRDQLSLMFRDESSKVIQKAHAQWGTGSPDQANPPSAISSTGSASWTSSSPSSSSVSGITSPGPQSPQSTPRSSASHHNSQMVTVPKLHRVVDPNLEQRGVQFFIDRYLMNHPDAPEDSEHLEIYSGKSEAMYNVMTAVGLAGLSNTQGNRDMNMLSRQVYTLALKQTGLLIASRKAEPASIIPPLRAVIMLALFEVVQGKGSKLSTGTANIHIFGAIALLRSVLPVVHVPAGGARAILQLMFSLFIPSQLSETPLPPAFFECLRLCKQLLPPEERCCCDIAVAIARFLQVAPMARRANLIDGTPATDGVFQQLLGMDAVLNRLDEQMQVGYPWRVEMGDFPPAAIFHGKYHVYSEIWGARIWNHLRWARILVNQQILALSDEHPMSSAHIVSPTQRNECFAVIKRMAEDTLVSTPSHWRHPIVDVQQAKQFAANGKGGSGAVGLPTLLWHLKIAGCAPGVPTDYWDWSYAVMQVVWKDMGMQHALALSEVMEGHKAGQEKEAIDRILKIEEDW